MDKPLPLNSPWRTLVFLAAIVSSWGKHIVRSSRKRWIDMNSVLLIFKRHVFNRNWASQDVMSTCTRWVRKVARSVVQKLPPGLVPRSLLVVWPSEHPSLKWFQACKFCDSARQQVSTSMVSKPRSKCLRSKWQVYVGTDNIVSASLVSTWQRNMQQDELYKLLWNHMKAWIVSFLHPFWMCLKRKWIIQQTSLQESRTSQEETAPLRDAQDTPSVSPQAWQPNSVFKYYCIYQISDNIDDLLKDFTSHHQTSPKWYH